jgi:hypothetical protein
MTILKLTEEMKKYFISSNLLADDGIECPEWIADICTLVDNYPKFRIKLKHLKMQKLIELYDFFDEYCISKGLLKVIEAKITNYENALDRVNLVCYKQDGGDEMYISYRGKTIFESKEFTIDYNGISNRCEIYQIKDISIYFNLVSNNDRSFLIFMGQNEVYWHSVGYFNILR